MHRLLRHAGYAVMGIGLGVASALALAAAPSAAQSTSEPSTEFYAQWKLDPSAQIGVGDTITAHGWLKDGNGTEIGTSSISCVSHKLDGPDWLAQCDVTNVTTSGNIHLSFHLSYDNTSDEFRKAEGVIHGGTGSYKWQSGDAVLIRCEQPQCHDDDTYRIKHNWSDPDA